jgi:type I restriction enzyme R subunit
MTTGHTSSFAFLAPYGPLYLQLVTVAERALALDPSLTLLKLRQLAEAFAQRAASSAGLAEVGRDTNQHDLLRMLEQRGIVTEHIAEVFHILRRAGNRAAHDFVGTHQDALNALGATEIAEATGLAAAAVKRALATLVDTGHVRVHGRARGTTYEWSA